MATSGERGIGIAADAGLSGSGAGHGRDADRSGRSTRARGLYAAPEGLGSESGGFTCAVRRGSGEMRGAIRLRVRRSFRLNASLGRTFRVSDRLNLDLRVDSTNALNHVNYSSWNTTINSAQFGLPVSANAMRSMQTTLRLRF